MADIPVITTEDFAKIYNNSGSFNISGTCDSTEQFIQVLKDDSEIGNAVYVPALQGTFNVLSIPVTSGIQTIKVKSYDGSFSDVSNTLTVTGTNRAVTQEDGNIESKIYNGLKTILTDNVDIGVSTIIYEGQERVMPCIEIDLIEEELNEKFSCFELINVSFVVRAMTKDNHSFVSGQFDDSDISGTRNGNAHFINKVREEIMKDFSSQIPELIDLQYQSLTKIEQTDEISGYELTFTGLYNRPRVN